MYDVESISPVDILCVVNYKLPGYHPLTPNVNITQHHANNNTNTSSDLGRS